MVQMDRDSNGMDARRIIRVRRAANCLPMDRAQLMQPIPTSLCPLCGLPNKCAPARCGSFDVPCWCREKVIPQEILDQIPISQLGKACLCPACASSISSGSGADHPGCL